MLNRRMYFVRERVGFLKLSDTYDILDPETQSQLGIAQEKPGAFMQEILSNVVDGLDLSIPS